MDAAGNTSADVTVPLRIDRAAPTTTVQIDGAAPVGTYGQPAKVELSADDAGGSGVAATQYRLDGGQWTDYTGSPLTVSDSRPAPDRVRVDRQRRQPGERQAACVQPRRAAAEHRRPGHADPARRRGRARAEAVAVGRPGRGALLPVDDRGFRRGKLSVAIRCQSVERGTLTLKVTKKVAKRLGLKSTTLAKAAVRCEGAGTTVTLKPSSTVKRKLAAKQRGSLEATLSVRLSGDGGTASDSALLTLRR